MDSSRTPACIGKNMRTWLALLGLLLHGVAAYADISPADYIYLPAVEAGERELDIKYGSYSPVAGAGMQAGSVGFGYGVNARWFSEIYLKRENTGGTGTTLAEWENKFQLTETGEYPIDLGFITELETPINGKAPYEIRLGPLLQSEFGKLQLNGNLLLTRVFGAADESSPPNTTNLLYQWQIKYPLSVPLDVGVQGFGAVGKWNQWDPPNQQDHRIGPAIMGKFSLGGRNIIKYNAAWLYGASVMAPAHTFRVQVEYEF
jgi:hypothetical protein